MSEYTLHDGIWVKVFNFWFYFMEKKGFSTIIGIVYGDNEANLVLMKMGNDTYRTLL